MLFGGFIYMSGFQGEDEVNLFIYFLLTLMLLHYTFFLVGNEHIFSNKIVPQQPSITVKCLLKTFPLLLLKGVK